MPAQGGCERSHPCSEDVTRGLRQSQPGARARRPLEAEDDFVTRTNTCSLPCLHPGWESELSALAPAGHSPYHCARPFGQCLLLPSQLPESYSDTLAFWMSNLRLIIKLRNGELGLPPEPRELRCPVLLSPCSTEKAGRIGMRKGQ